MYGSVIDNLARFRRAVLGVGHFYRKVSWVRVPNFTKLGEDLGGSFLHNKFV